MYSVSFSLMGGILFCRHAKEEAEKKEREERQKRQEELRQKRKVRAQHCKQVLQLNCTATLQYLSMRCWGDSPQFAAQPSFRCSRKSGCACSKRNWKGRHRKRGREKQLTRRKSASERQPDSR